MAKKEYLNLTVESETAIVLDAMVKHVMRDPETHTDEYLKKLDKEKLKATKAALIQSGAEIIKSLKYINSIL